MFSTNAEKFFLNQNIPENLPENVSCLNPYQSNEVREIVNRFFTKFYDDDNERIFIVGINPGRFGGGITGIAFTDPINLERKCGIQNSFDKRHELSSRFVYNLINEFGGTEKFYKKFFITALFPLALIKDEKNFNYYDSKKIYGTLKPHILKTFNDQINFGASNKIAISFGKKNAEYLKEINNEIGFFDSIIYFDYPRFIMQYRSKKIPEYLENYSKILRNL